MTGELQKQGPVQSADIEVPASSILPARGRPPARGTLVAKDHVEKDGKPGQGGLTVVDMLVVGGKRGLQHSHVASAVGAYSLQAVHRGRRFAHSTPSSL